jgi:hypothetical protein
LRKKDVEWPETGVWDLRRSSFLRMRTALIGPAYVHFGADPAQDVPQREGNELVIAFIALDKDAWRSGSADIAQGHFYGALGQLSDGDFFGYEIRAADRSILQGSFQKLGWHLFQEGGPRDPKGLAGAYGGAFLVRSQHLRRALIGRDGQRLL